MGPHREHAEPAGSDAPGQHKAHGRGCGGGGCERAGAPPSSTALVPRVPAAQTERSGRQGDRERDTGRETQGETWQTETGSYRYGWIFSLRSHPDKPGGLASIAVSVRDRCPPRRSRVGQASVRVDQQIVISDLLYYTRSSSTLLTPGSKRQHAMLCEGPGAWSGAAAAGQPHQRGHQ